MTQPLSQDLRRRIVQAVAAGRSIRQAAARFEVSPSTAIKLMQRVRATGSTRPAKIGGYRQPLLHGHDDLLREMTSAKAWDHARRDQSCAVGMGHRGRAHLDDLDDAAPARLVA